MIYNRTFRAHLSLREIIQKIKAFSSELTGCYDLYQLLLFHFQKKRPDEFFGLIQEALPSVHPIFQTVFRTFIKDRDKVINALKMPYSNAKLEITNNLIKVIKRNAFGFWLS
ncbi:transposase [Streptococcus mutans]|nr:transposase [Streptococcus mutans]